VLNFELERERCVPKVLKLSFEVCECKPLLSGATKSPLVSPLKAVEILGRGLHSSTFQLNLSQFRHKTHPRHPLIPPNNPSTTPRQPLNNP
jgi:hypothetical protein